MKTNDIAKSTILSACKNRNVCKQFDKLLKLKFKKSLKTQRSQSAHSAIRQVEAIQQKDLSSACIVENVWYISL